ncbi:NYN domain-containing protein [Acinetobacter sp. c3-l95]|uniref:NYN domain-containing protein n=1 Tax=Acinetobacter sp. c3-l95 TaxID=3342804 RepID=UPI0035BA4955
MSFKNIAILIDADNASANMFAKIFTHIETLGKITCRKIYGDWGQSNLGSWQENILKYALEPMQQFAYVKGKNATDIALVIEAMDLLHSNQYDCFCLISSDSDFASLAVRIRKNNIPVYGFGEKKAVVSFRQACTQFIEVENLKNYNIQNAVYDMQQLRKEKPLINAINDILQNIPQGEWLNIGTLGSLLNQKLPDFSPKKYGYARVC